MSARTKARKRALDVLFEADIRGSDPLQVLIDRRDQADPPINVYSEELVTGVQANRGRIDELIATYSQGWDLDRMPPVDRNLLRIGIYEMMWSEDVPVAVAIDEAVELARTLSTEESSSFVNGVLGRIAKLKEKSNS
ncbi:MAG TPA: transcription antitermination factor NusB [Candidatus Nanopelagicaceae bacterium]|nr:transcription antitermination factor NusB [Candidatus Nanopelagicaceae bacterium]